MEKKLVKFTNTDWFGQINWDKEIANEKPVKDDAQALRASTAALVWSLVQSNIRLSKNNREPHTMANILRMHEYFYAKFVYHHESYYKRDCDIVKTTKEYKRGEHPIVALRNEIGIKDLKRSKLPMDKIKAIEGIFKKVIEQNRKEEKSKDGGYEEAKMMVEKEGLKCIKPKGSPKYGDRDVVCTVIDGIPYHIYLMKNGSFSERRNQAKAKEECNDLKRMLSRYKPLVTRTYEKIKTFKDIGNVWVMEGGGAQCQVFFGNETGYLGILYLDLKETKSTNFEKPFYRFVVNGYKNDPLFKDFNVKGIKVVTSESIYGKN